MKNRYKLLLKVGYSYHFNGAIFILACFIASVCYQSLAYAATYYVSKTGNNGNSCALSQNVNTAKLTIAAGITCLASGDTLIVKAGTYNEMFDLFNPANGSDSAYTTIKAAPGETVWLRPLSFASAPPGSYARILKFQDGRHHIKVERINIDGSGLPQDGKYSVSLLVTGHRSHYLIFDGIEMKHSRGDAIHFDPSAYGNILRNSYLHDVGPSIADDSPAGGIYLRGPKLDEVLIPNATLANTPGNLIENNRFENIGDVGIGQRTPVVNNTIRGNVFNNVGVSIGFGGDNQNTSFYNNIVSNNKECMKFYYGYSLTMKIYNNTFYNSGNGPFGCFSHTGRADISSPGSNAVRNNIFYEVTVNGSIPANNFIGNPLFVNADQGNFKLQEGSPAIDTGETLSEVTTDIEGNPRPLGAAYDPGAYEFDSGNGVPPPPVGVLYPPTIRVEKP